MGKYEEGLRDIDTIVKSRFNWTIIQDTMNNNHINNSEKDVDIQQQYNEYQQELQTYMNEERTYTEHLYSLEDQMSQEEFESLLKQLGNKLAEISFHPHIEDVLDKDVELVNALNKTESAIRMMKTSINTSTNNNQRLIAQGELEYYINDMLKHPHGSERLAAIDNSQDINRGAR